jgi:DNA-binding HxlR family transcriptional regulator
MLARGEVGLGVPLRAKQHRFGLSDRLVGRTRRFERTDGGERMNADQFLETLASAELACPVELRERLDVIKRAYKTLSGKWKSEILLLLSLCPMRFNEIKRSIPGITQHMLSAQLRALEGAGLVVRRVYQDAPLRFEYEMSESGRALRPITEAIYRWGLRYAQAMQER